MCIFNIMKAILIQLICVTVSTSCYVYGSLFGILQDHLISDIDTITKYEPSIYLSSIQFYFESSRFLQTTYTNKY